MAQLAVEWLIEQMLKQGYFDGNKPLTYTNLDHLQHQAIQMEKDQHSNTWDLALLRMEARGGNFVRAWEDFDEYWEKKLEKNKKNGK